MRLEKPDQIEHLLQILANNNPKKSRDAIKKLAELGNGYVVESLIPHLNDQDLKFRVTVIKALGLLGDHRVSKPLISALRTENNHMVRIVIADALSNLKDPQTIEPIISALNEEAFHLTWIAMVEALGKLDTFTAINLITQVLNDGRMNRQQLLDVCTKTCKRNQQCLETKHTLLVCLKCFTRFQYQEISVVPSIMHNYYGCRSCGQSRVDLIGNSEQIVAILDMGQTEKYVQQDNQLLVNWLVHKNVFDFEGVIIMKASDEDAERFAVQVGNDTDPIRKENYETMQCVVSTDCSITKNSLWVLQQMFGVVEIKNYPSLKSKH